MRRPATTVVPIPFSQGCAATADITRSFAFSIAIARRLLLNWSSWLYLNGQVASSFWRVAAMNSPIVSTVIFAATSPAAWPPMPSATMKSPSVSSRAYASSLCLRFLPTSVSPNASMAAIFSISSGPPAASGSLRAPCAHPPPDGSQRSASWYAFSAFVRSPAWRKIAPASRSSVPLCGSSPIAVSIALTAARMSPARDEARPR